MRELGTVLSTCLQMICEILGSRSLERRRLIRVPLICRRWGGKIYSPLYPPKVNKYFAPEVPYFSKIGEVPDARLTQTTSSRIFAIDVRVRAP